jgi:hypothetical protein
MYLDPYLATDGGCFLGRAVRDRLVRGGAAALLARRSTRSRAGRARMPQITVGRPPRTSDHRAPTEEEAAAVGEYGDISGYAQAIEKLTAG